MRWGTASVRRFRPAALCAFALCLAACAPLAPVPPPAGGGRIAPSADIRVRVGADVLLRDSLQLVRGRRVGVVCNRASLLADGRHLLAALRAQPGVTVAVVFSPEHGFDAAAPAGAAVSDTAAAAGTGEDIFGPGAPPPVVSLYGARRAPDSAQLAQLDALLFDLQDVGARWYTYTSTMALCAEAAARAGLPFVVLDRPNPAGGAAVRGPRPDSAGAFVGRLPVPARHGMTAGELLRMAAGEGWIAAQGADLRVVPMQGWRRDMLWEDTGLPWIPPSPNLPDARTALVYLGTGLVEGSDASEGRGTPAPFLQVGAPGLDAAQLLRRLAADSLPGLRCAEARFTPRPGPRDPAPKHLGSVCNGVRLDAADPRRFDPLRSGIALLAALRANDGVKIRLTPYLDLLFGTAAVRRSLEEGRAPEEILAGWTHSEREFRLRRMPYLLYP